MAHTFYFAHSAGVKRVKAPSGSVLQAFRASSVEMRVFNVGPGEAILLSLGSRTVLFDGGAIVKKSNASLGRALLAYLVARNLKLGAIVATHPHVDHLNALATILAEDDPPSLAPDAVYYHNDEALGTWLTETLWARVTALETAGRLIVVPVTAGVAGLGLPGVEMQHFVDGRYKPTPAYKSIFTIAWYGESSFLFTGDAYIEYENALLAGPIVGLLSAHVLKITHHGSQDGTGQPFVDQALPRLSVASTAADEGHRLESVVKARLDAYGKSFDTLGAGGDIIIRTDGRARSIGSVSGVLYEVSVEKPGWYYGQAW